MTKTSIYDAHSIFAPGVWIMRNIKFGKKALIISSIFLLPFLAISFYLIGQLNDLEWGSRKNTLTSNIDVAYSILEHSYNLEKNGKTLEEAQEIAKSSIEAMRYNQVEYFWINDMSSKILMHPINKALNNKDGSSIKDPNGVFIFNEFVKKVNSDKSGFVAYQWPKPNDKEKTPVDKLSYVKGFEHFLYFSIP